MVVLSDLFGVLGISVGVCCLIELVQWIIIYRSIPHQSPYTAPNAVIAATETVVPAAGRLTCRIGHALIATSLAAGARHSAARIQRCDKLPSGLAAQEAKG